MVDDGRHLREEVVVWDGKVQDEDVRVRRSRGETCPARGDDCPDASSLDSTEEGARHSLGIFDGDGSEANTWEMEIQ